MNKFTKILTGVIATAGVAALGGAVACKTVEVEPTYYRLNFEGTGLDFVLQGDLAQTDEDGNSFIVGKVKEGVEVSFKILRGDNTEGTLKILKNGEEITPDAEGVYKFVISADTVISAEGLSKLCALNLHKGQRAGTATDGSIIYEERRITYIGEDGKELGDVVNVVEGRDFRFKIKISPYYKDEYNVVYGTEELVPDKDGYYTMSDVKGDERGEAHVSVNKLVEADPFQVRTGCGDGTKENPYKISEPIDLFNLAALVNMNRYSYFNNAYYVLEKDIDMQGEQLFVIGNGENGSSVFSGVFDGNGHTISNFYITDEVIDTESYQTAYLQVAGLFGYVATNAELGYAAEIKNLTLENYEITAHPVVSQNVSYVGSVAAYSVGLNMSNCHAVNGKIELNGNNNYMIYAGGLSGYMQAAYNGDVAHHAVIQSSSADVDINGIGSPRMVGGVVGYLVSSDESATGYVVNSFSTGSISGAMYAGGIAGGIGRFSSISNCYSTVDVYASNLLSGSNIPEDYRVAYAGGIAGYAEDDTVIAYCYAANKDLGAYAGSGTNYQRTGHIAAAWSTGTLSSQNSTEFYAHHNLIAADGAKITDMGWLSGDWAQPTEEDKEKNRDILLKVNVSESPQSYALKVKCVRGGSAEVDLNKTVGAGNPRATMFDWYKTLDEYYEDNSGKRSWGYFFDEELQHRVPYGFVPANGETELYFGLADYSEVAGTYYIKADSYTNSASFQLTADGKMYFRQGGMSHESSFTYNGTSVMLLDTCLGALKYEFERINGEFYAVEGTKTQDGGFALTGVAYLTDTTTTGEGENATTQTEHTFDVFEFTAIKKDANFGYGEYTSNDGTETFEFLENMTGLYTNKNGTVEEYTYSFTEGGLNLSIGSWTAKVEEGKVTEVKNVAVSKMNEFGGSWSKSAGSGILFSFDGKNTVTYTAGKAAPQTAEYTVDGDTGRAVFNIGTTPYEAFIDSQSGFLVINGETYYRNDGFTGNWYMSSENESVEIRLEGLGNGEYGYGYISYSGSLISNMEAQYDVVKYSDATVVRLYVGSEPYGELILSADGKSMRGMLYSLNNSGYYRSASLYLFDNFRGVWASNLAGVESVTFNGRSANGLTDVVIRRSTGTERGTYTLTDNFSGTITAGEKSYEIALDEFTGRVTISEKDGATGGLARRDRWYNAVLYDGDTSYTFDGKGYLDGGGTVKVSGGDDLTYSVAADGSLTIGGKTVTVDGQGVHYGDDKILVFKTGLAGEWLVSGTGKKLTVIEAGGDLIAKVSYDGGNPYDFVYSPADDTITLTEETVGSRITTVIKIMDIAGKELSISRSGLDEDSEYTGIAASEVDAYAGEYTAADGSRWTFDGLGFAKFGSGTAYFINADREREKFSYSIDEFGTPYAVSASANKGYRFVAVSEGEGYTKQGDATVYTAVEVNALYGVSAQGTFGGSPVRFVFDGISSVFAEGHSEKAYGYKVISSSEAELTDGENNVLYGEITTEGKINYLEVKTYEELYTDREVLVAEDGQAVNFLFMSDGKLYRVEGDKKTEEYSYEIVSAYQVNLTKNGKKYTGKITRVSAGLLLTVEEVKED